MFYIRWMMVKDIDAVLAIDAESYPDPWDEQQLRTTLRQRDNIGMVAESDTGEIVAYMVYELKKRCLVVPRLAVHPKYRLGGIGRAMLDKLQAKLHPDRRNRIQIELHEINLNGHLFLRACGFRAVEVLRDDDAYRFEFWCKSAVETVWRAW